MKALITEEEAINELANELGEATQKFYRATLKQLVGYKVWLGRKITESPLYGQYGENLIGRLVQESGLRETILYEAVKMYEVEQLTPATEKKFLESFDDQYSSWNEYRAERLGVSTGGKLEPKCKQCQLHCK